MYLLSSLNPLTFLLILLTLSALNCAASEISAERQVTFAPQSHWLDNNDNFSRDRRFLCYDTRETVGPGIDNGQTIEVLELTTWRSIILYKPDAIISGDAPAPGVGAVSFNPAATEVSFIHGPPVSEVSWRGPYGKPNRNGGRIQLVGDIIEQDGAIHMLKNGAYVFNWLDTRDIAVDRDTLPGAHRGGTHRHEYCADGTRIGFTYDDFLLPAYDRTIGFMEPHDKAPTPASHYFAILVPVVPMGTAKPGELEKAYGDAWVDSAGSMRAFIGKTRCEDGETYEESLFVVDIPPDVDITTADSGNASRYPQPPKGTRIRRLTHAWAGGIVRGSPDGKRIAYYGKDEQDRTQIFIIDALGSDRAENALMRPRQATFFETGTESGLRWHPDGQALISVCDNGIAVTCILDGPHFGKSLFLTPYGDGVDRHAPVLSWDGRKLAYNRPVETTDANGNIVKNYAGQDFIQIFLLDLPESLLSLFD